MSLGGRIWSCRALAMRNAAQAAMTAWKLVGGDGTQEEKNSCWDEKRGGGCEGCSIIYPTLPSAQLLMDKKENMYKSGPG